MLQCLLSIKKEDYIENEEEIDVYVEKIRENKQQYQNDFLFWCISYKK